MPSNQASLWNEPERDNVVCCVSIYVGIALHQQVILTLVRIYFLHCLRFPLRLYAPLYRLYWSCISHPCLHFFLFCTITSNSVRIVSCSVSMKMFPATAWSCCTLIANFSSLLLPILKMCSSHLCLCLRCLIDPTKSKVIFLTLTSSCMILPVMRLRHLVLAPLMASIVLVSRCQASLPYVNRE